MAIFETLTFCGTKATAVEPRTDTATTASDGKAIPVAIVGHEILYAVAPASSTVIVTTFDGQTSVEVIANPKNEWMDQDGAEARRWVNGKPEGTQEK